MPLTGANLQHIKAAYSVRRVPKSAMHTLLMGDLCPRSGDLVLAEIVRLGHHRRIELGNGRRAHLYPGDRVILCYGNRYAPDQFEAYVPEHLEPCQMVAAGGIAARQHSKHSAVKDATEILPLGLLGDDRGRPLNLADWAIPAKKADTCPLTLAVLGTAMNAGKTTTAAHLIRGLSRAGLKVGAAKITGTGAGGDVWLMQDHGADPVLDFTDAGFASTFRLPPETLERIAATLCGHLVEAGVEVLVLEIADGLLQGETAALVTSTWFRQQVDGVLFAAADALGAKAGVEMVRQQKLPLVAVSGALTASPLASAEATLAVSCPVLDKDALTSETVLEILGFAKTLRLRTA
ncbi:MAG: malic enzyme protein [Methylothermaceae bacteria B42]|nr:MAG: malic enzyme protein [Methylothermaceae bacteria B42]HHJ39773.1 DUF1611 domain-containing protein [Methylothermaceae bacterium]